MKTLNNKCQHLLHFIAINTQRNIGYAFYTCNISQYMLNVHWRMVFSNEKDVHNALIPLLNKGYIARVQRGVYMITLLGVQYFGDTFSELCAELQSEKNTQPEEIEQLKQNEEDFSYVKDMKNYKFLFVKLLDMIISTPEFKNDTHLIVKILTDLKNDGWFKETPDGRFPICEDAIKVYTQFMNEEGRKIIDDNISSNCEIPQPKQNETNYETAMKLCETAMKLCKEATNMCRKVSYM